MIGGTERDTDGSGCGRDKWGQGQFKCIGLEEFLWTQYFLEQSRWLYLHASSSQKEISKVGAPKNKHEGRTPNKSSFI